MCQSHGRSFGSNLSAAMARVTMWWLMAVPCFDTGFRGFSMLNLRLVLGMATSLKKALLYALSLSFKFSRCSHSEMFSRCCAGTSSWHLRWLGRPRLKQNRSW